MHIAKLFKNGQSQAVRLPKEYRFEGEDVYIKKYGNLVLLIPKNDPWAIMFEGIEEFTDDFMNDRNQPEQQVRNDL